MSASSIFLAALTASVAAAVTVAAPASAEPVTTTTTMVRYGDLNLASATGAEALKARVARAARQVCEINGDKSLDAAMQSRSCTKVAMNKAMPQVELALANAGTQLADAGRVTISAR